MPRVLGLVCICALVALATPCCLPDQVSLDWKMKMNVTNSYGGNTMQNSEAFSGSAAYDLKKQVFYLHIDDLPEKIVLNLSKQPGEVITESTRQWSGDGQEMKYCSAANDVTGTVGKPWKCIFDNTNIFTKVDGEAGYLLFIPGFMYGPVTMQKDVCLPMSADVEVLIGDPGGSVATVAIELSNVKEKVDASVFEAPCQPDPARYGYGPAGNSFQIPTPDEFVQMVLSSRHRPTDSPMPEPQAEVEEEEEEDTVEAEDEDNEENENEDEDHEEVDSAHEASSQAQKRYCQICF